MALAGLMLACLSLLTEIRDRSGELELSKEREKLGQREMEWERERERDRTVRPLHLIALDSRY